MTDRPSILPGILAEFIAAAPSRLQKRIDANPEAANDFAWTRTDDIWFVAAGEEKVQLKSQLIQSLDDVECTCLLGPRCFHVLASLSLLRISDTVDVPDVENASQEPEFGIVKEVSTDSLEGPPEAESLSESQSFAARDMMKQCSDILAAGLRAAGSVLQSRLLRCIHECRAEGLHRLAAAGLRVMHNIRQVRTNADTFDSNLAAQDLTEALEVAWLLIQNPADPPSSTLGVARRRYTPVTSLKLHGLCCEAVITRSGYAGVVTWMMADDGWICTVSDVQPGDVSRIPQAWRSGVSVAGLAMSHRELSQRCLLVSKATRSSDGRLGGADSARAVAIEGQGWEAAPVRRAFEVPLTQQIQRCFSCLTVPELERKAGYDLLFVQGVVAGAADASLLLELHGQPRSLLQLDIPIESDSMPGRSNLTLLARAPGLALRCIARLNPAHPGHATLLAIAPAPMESTVAEMPQAQAPALCLPEEFRFCASTGLDQLSRSHLSSAERHPVEVQTPTARMQDPEDVLQRWLNAIALGGRHAIPTGTVTSVVRDAAALRRQFRPTAALLLHSLAKTAISSSTDLNGIRFPDNAENLGQYWLAASVAARTTSQHMQQAQWLVIADG